MPAFAPPDRPSPDELELWLVVESELVLAAVALGTELEVEDEDPELKSSAVTLKQGALMVKSFVSTKV